jgi:hypothetical protein
LTPTSNATATEANLGEEVVADAAAGPVELCGIGHYPQVGVPEVFSRSALKLLRA